MSTKIYNVYQFRGSNHDLMQFLHGVRDRFKTEAVKHFVNIEDYPLAGRTMKTASSFEIRDAVKAAIKEGTWDILNIDAVVVVYFHKRRTLVQFLGMERPDLIGINSVVRADARFSDFHYQNQVDPWYDYEKLEGEELKKAQRDWRVRRKVWNEIFDRHDTPAQAGMSYHLLDDSTLWNICWETKQHFLRQKGEVTAEDFK